MAIESNRNQTKSGDVLWSQEIWATDGTTRLLAGQIKMVADADATPAAASTRLEIYTATTAGTLTKALVIGAAQDIAAQAIFKLAGIETGLTAHAGGTQAAALALSASKPIHEVTTVGSANDSISLPLATGSGAIHWVKNSAAANSLQLFGAGTDTIDGVATATGVAVAAGKSRILVDSASGKWQSISGA